MKPDHILRWDKTLNNQSIGIGAAGTDIALGERKIIGITVPNANCYILFSTGGTDASNTNGTRLGTGTSVFDTGFWTFLSIFNDDAAASRISVFEGS